ncbi:hypothetical protein YC2023_057418 [Brassica napus]
MSSCFAGMCPDVKSREVGLHIYYSCLNWSSRRIGDLSGSDLSESDLSGSDSR